MTLFQQRFKEYFRKNRERINDAEITICIGNEGMDLDSFISSLIVGYAEDVIHVVNMRKEVFLSKGELMFVCDHFHINVDDLIYLERPLGGMKREVKEIGTYFLVENVTIPLKEKKVKLFLTDHNEPVDELKNSEVSMIIDHHRLENKVEMAKRIYIDVDVGSATTLVGKYLGDDLSRKHHCISDPKNKDPEKETLCVSIAKILLVPILIDTSHLRRRASIFDAIEYKRLRKKANMKKNELKEMRKKIKTARLNDHKLPTDIILQKDFKQYYQGEMTFGIAVVKYKFEDWIEREGKNIEGVNKNKIGVGLFLRLDEFRRKLGLDFLIVGCKLDGKRHFIFVKFPLIEMFSKQNGFQLIDYKGIEFYNSPVEKSRKMIAPIIREFLSNISFKK